MQQLEFVKATDLDEAWSNFDPVEPLPSGSPFYVMRQGNPIGALTRALLRRHLQPPKYFFSGHRGSGKSTELNCLVSDPGIQEKFFPVKFSVRKLCDINNLNYVDVLLAIGAQVFVQYTESGGRLPNDLLKELETWKGRTVERLTEKGAMFATGAGFDVKAFFVSALAKVQTEHSSREIIRQELEPRLSELIAKINDIVITIQSKEKRQVLVVIDDLDKPPLPQARDIFHSAYSAITQPVCAIVYTVPVAIFFSKEFATIRENCFFLPNVKLHPKGEAKERDSTGYATMQSFVHARMEESLIESEALQAAVDLSGGVFREMAFVMQLTTSHAIERGSNRIEVVNVERAESRIRSDFRRILTDEDYELLKEVRTSNEMRSVDKLADLLHTLAVLEYTNDENWCDVHPSLRKLLGEEQ
jgi:hypothetical protein